MTFWWVSKFTSENALRIETVFRQSMSAGTSFNRTQVRLREQGLGYNRQQMQQDYRRFQAIDRSKTEEARTRAISWYDKVFVPLQKQIGVKAATALIKSIKIGTIETLEQAKKMGQYAELYEEAGLLT